MLNRSYGVGGGHTQCPCVPADGLVHQPGLADLQSAAHLSAGWRPDSSFFALVCAGTRPQLDGRHGDRVSSVWRGSSFSPSGCNPPGLAFSRIHPDELLERTEQARALLRMAKLPRREGFACPSCKTAPPVGAFWKCSRCRRALRHLPNASRLPALRGAVCRDEVPGLRRPVSDERVDCSRPRAAEAGRAGAIG